MIIIDIQKGKLRGKNGGEISDKSISGKKPLKSSDMGVYSPHSGN